MGAVNVTVRVDEEMKKEFDTFCDNVGMNITTAFNMFMRATLRTRELPFVVTDVPASKQGRAALLQAFKASQEEAIVNGTDSMTMDEINEIITESRRENPVKL